MTKTETKCDACGRDLTTTGSRPDFRLTLSCQRLPHDNDMVYDVIVYPPIEREHHFCGIGCLAEWLKNRTEKA